MASPANHQSRPRDDARDDVRDDPRGGRRRRVRARVNDDDAFVAVAGEDARRDVVDDDAAHRAHHPVREANGGREEWAPWPPRGAWTIGAPTPETTCETCAPVRDSSVAYTSTWFACLDPEPGIVVSARAGCARCARERVDARESVNARGVLATTALHEAAAVGNEEVVSLLLAHGAVVDATDKEGRTALWRACAEGRAACVEALLRAGANSAVDDLRGISALHAASTLVGDVMGMTIRAAIDADEERARVVRALVTHGANEARFNIDVRDVIGETALVCAAKRGAVRVIEALLDAGADPMIRTTCKLTAYMVFQTDPRRGAEVSVAAVKERLWNLTAPLNLISSIQRGDSITPRVYLERGAAAHVNDEVTFSSKTTPLIEACEYGRASVAEMLVDEYGAGVNVANSSGNTPLAAAAGNGQIRIVEMLLARGAAVNMCPQQVPAEKSALSCASANGHLNIVRTLIARGADINPERGQTPLMLAAKYGHMQVVRELIREGASIDAHRDSAAALVLAAEAGRVEVVRALLDAGACTYDDYAYSAVLASCENGHVDVLEALIERDVDLFPNYRNQSDGALILAVKGKHEDVVRVLLNNGVHVEAESSDRKTALTIAIKEGFFDIAALLIERGADVNVPAPSDGHTPLMYAVREGYLCIAEMLLQSGARLEEKCERGRTALMFAALYDRAIIAEKLIESGADIHTRSYSHKTAIHYAVDARNDSVVRILEANGAVYQPINRMSRTLARCEKHVAAILKLVAPNAAAADDDDDKRDLADDFVDATHELLQRFTDGVTNDSKDAAVDALNELLVTMENHSRDMPESVSIDFCALLQKLYAECTRKHQDRQRWLPLFHDDDDSD